MWSEETKRECLMQLQHAESLLLATHQKLELGKLTKEEFRERLLDISDRLANAHWVAGLDTSQGSDE